MSEIYIEAPNRGDVQEWELAELVSDICSVERGFDVVIGAPRAAPPAGVRGVIWAELFLISLPIVADDVARHLIQQLEAAAAAWSERRFSRRKETGQPNTRPKHFIVRAADEAVLAEFEFKYVWPDEEPEPDPPTETPNHGPLDLGKLALDADELLALRKGQVEVEAIRVWLDQKGTAVLEREDWSPEYVGLPVYYLDLRAAELRGVGTIEINEVRVREQEAMIRFEATVDCRFEYSRRSGPDPQPPPKYRGRWWKRIRGETYIRESDLLSAGVGLRLTISLVDGTVLSADVLSWFG